jgi:hypothetical protein
MKNFTIGLGLASVALLVATGCGDKTTNPSGGQTIDPADFVSTIDNPYLPLAPGTVFHYEGTGDGNPEINTVRVTHLTKLILGVTCVVVADTVLAGGELAEATADWYAQDRDGNVWYFGEDSKQYQGGVVVGTEGSWEAGVDGARAGIVMEAHPRVGDSYRQEYLKDVAEDQAQVLALSASVTVPFGSYANCLQTKEWSRLEPGVVEDKYYAQSVGVLKAVTVEGGSDHSELVSITTE